MAFSQMIYYGLEAGRVLNAIEVIQKERKVKDDGQVVIGLTIE